MNKKEHNCFYKKDGFTYVELLIVVGIMIIFGVFFVMAVDPVGKIKAQRDSQRESDINSILLSVEQKIRNDRGWNCPAGPLPQDKFTAIGTGPGEYDLYGCLMPNYLSKYLVDPKEGSITGRNITDGLVGHWKFDEGSGTIAYDASGNNNHGTLVDGPNWVDGKIGGALDFDGSNDYVEVDNQDILTSDHITIAAWIKHYGKSGSNQNIITKRTSLDNSQFEFKLNASYNLNFDRYLPTGGSVSSNNIITLDTWTFVAMALKDDEDEVAFYINGLLDSINLYSESYLGDSSSIITIGRSGCDSQDTSTDPWRNFNGQIDDVRVYDRALSPEEIQDLYNYEYSSKYAIWQNPVTKNISLKSLENETKEVSTGAPD